MIVVMSVIRVSNGNADALAERYANRLHLAESVAGCLGIEILRNRERTDEFTVYSRWESEAAYTSYRRSPSFRAAHARIADIPGGIRIAAEERRVDRYEVLS